MPAIPTPCVAFDLCILTKHAIRRSRLYYEFDGAPPTNEVQLGACCEHVKSQFGPAIAELLPDCHRFEKVEGTYFGAGGSGFVAASTSAAVDGELTSPDSLTEDEAIEGGSEDVMPDEAALIIQRRTGMRGRQNYGRLFLSGLSERINFAGQVTPDFHGLAKAVAALVPADMNVAAEDYTGLMHARHWNRKDNILMPVTKAYVVGAIGTRKDRRPPLTLERL